MELLCNQAGFVAGAWDQLGVELSLRDERSTCRQRSPARRESSTAAGRLRRNTVGAASTQAEVAALGLGQGAGQAQADAVAGVRALLGERVGVGGGLGPSSRDVDLDLRPSIGSRATPTTPATVSQGVVEQHVEHVVDRRHVDVARGRRRPSTRSDRPATANRRLPLVDCGSRTSAATSHHDGLALAVAGEGEQARDRRLQPVEGTEALEQDRRVRRRVERRARPRRRRASPRPASQLVGYV